MNIKLRVSSSIAPFREKALKTWGLEQREVGDFTSDVLFFGLYHLSDWKVFMKCKGKRYCSWAGGDIRNLLRGYAFSDGVELWKSKLFSFIPWHWIFKLKAEHYCENRDEQKKLASLGIKAEIVPTFLEDINEFPVSYKPNDKPNVYISARKGQESEYGVFKIIELSNRLKDFTFHIYGIGGESKENLIFHGNVPPEQFNEDIKNYQIALRLNKSDGFSEILCKGILLGQICISRLEYPYIDSYKTDDELIELLKTAKPNKAREHYKFNQFPFLTR